MRKHISIIIGVLLILKLCYVGMTALEWKFNSDNVVVGENLFKGVFAQNDAGWYLKIAEHGFPVLESPDADDLGCCDADCFYQSEYAFFPLFPSLIRIFSKGLGIHLLLTAIVLSIMLSLMAFIVFYQFARSWWEDDEKALISTLVLMLMPFHYFYGMIYSESLFLLLLMLSFGGILWRKWWMTAFSFSLLVICRPSGLLTGFPLLIFLAETLSREKGTSILTEIKNSGFWKKQWIWIPSIIVFAVYCYWLYVQTGDPLAFKTAQAGWCKKFMFPILALFRSGEFYAQFNSIYTCIFLLIAVALLFNSRLPASFQVLIWIGILLPLTGGSVVSMPRYISLIFPFFLLAGSSLGENKRGYAYLLALSVLHMASFHFWINAPHNLGL